jgi:hypothetical protein
MSDLLLEWMSFRRKGRLDELPAELMAGPPRRMLDDLNMLGHIEMLSASSWQVAVPVLAGLPPNESQVPAAILCGARTPALTGRIASACGTVGAQLNLTPVPNRPSRICITAPSLSLVADVAEVAGVPFQSNAAYTLLACLPSIRDWPRQPCQMVGGRVDTVRRFSASKRQWVESSLTEANAARRGFFRIKRDYDSVSILKSGPSDCAYIDDRAGRLFMASKLRLISWEGATRSLSLPVELYPPMLIARALALCTGSLPQFDRPSWRISFGGVGLAMQRLALAITGLRLA